MASQSLKVSGEIEDFLKNTVVKLATGVELNLKKNPSDGGTPIDTGWASSGWNVRVGSAVRYDDSQPDIVSQGDVSSRLQRSSSLTTLFSLNYKIEDGDAIISNNVPYIIELNDGSSRQAPSSFVQKAIARSISETS